MKRPPSIPVRADLRRGLLAAALLATFAGCGDRIQPGERAPEAPSVEGRPTAVVERRVEPAIEHASGTVASSRQTSVAAKILARIESIPVVAGSLVRKGDLVVRLDSRDLRARRSEAREGLRAARSRLELARRDAARIEKLAEADVASEEQRDQARSTLRVARADVNGAKQRLADAEVALSDAEIRTPVTGRVVDRLAEPGDMASPGVPLLRIYDPSALRLEAPVRESLAVALRVGQPLRAHLDALDETLEGHIEEIVPFAEPGARTLLVKVRLPESPRLFAGMYGRLEVPAGRRARLLIPETAVTRIGQLPFATSVDRDGHAERRWLTLGRPTEDGTLEVLSGLGEGERVLLPEHP